MDQAADLSRRMESLIRLGTVFAVDHGKARCRVRTGKLESAWLPWFTLRAGRTRHWNPPTINEQIMLLSPSGDPATGVVLTGIFSNANPAPSDSPNLTLTVYPDGARVSYDHVLGALVATGIKTALVDAANSISAKAGKAINLQAGAEINITAPKINIAGTVEQNGGPMSSNGIVVDTHTHIGVVPGPANTGLPQ